MLALIFCLIIFFSTLARFDFLFPIHDKLHLRFDLLSAFIFFS